MKRVFTLSIRSISAVFALLSLTVNINSAQAATETGWRYWGYFQADPGSKSWNYAQTGPAAAAPKDGAVEGWKFSFSSNTVDTGAPALKPNFGSICSGVKIQSGYIRVAVVVDYGSRIIAPKGESIQPLLRRCVVAKTGSNGLEILAKAVSVRTSASGFVCGLNNYPAKECSTEIETPKSLIKLLKK